MSGLKDLVQGVEFVVKSMSVTLKTIVTEAPNTVEYPEEPAAIYPRFRGRHELRRYEDGMERCIGCSLCEAACPTGAIYVLAAENDPNNPVSPGERHAEVYEVNLMRCIFCGDCQRACPTEAIVLGHNFELAQYERVNLILDKEALLNPPTPNVIVRPDA